MKKILAVLRLVFLTAAVNALGEGFASAESLLPSLRDSEAYQQYSKRPETEMSKLFYLLDRFKEFDFRVIYDGTEYDAGWALREAKKYVTRHYNKKDRAADWIKQHSYRSPSGGQIIYLKLTNGRKRMVLRDLLLEELEALGAVRT